MNSKLLLGLVVVVLVGVGVAFMSGAPDTQNPSSETAQMQDVQVQVQDPVGEDTSDTMEESTQTADATTSGAYSGEVLAGSTSPYIAFNQADYEKALAEGKTVFLDFYADWCPVCRAEEPDIAEGFDQLDSPEVVGFRVNYNDGETDEDEEALAEQFEVPYQHYKVILKEGEVVVKDSGIWDTETFINQVNKVI